MTTPEGKLKVGRRPNRRGEASRKHVLDVALHLLAGGGPDAVSVKLIAKEADVTWGTVQYQFGGADGFWAATILHILDTAGPRVWGRPSAGSIETRVAEVIDLLWNALNSPYNAAVTNLRTALAKNRSELQRNYPHTAHALDALDNNWLQQFREFFDGVDVDPRHARQVSALLPAALRGLHAERTFGSSLDVEDALVGLREAITLYMTPR
ncbi:TetR/AcrR family transcriptional regulator [Mycolicibacterium tusciae]|uniref:TetR/AcrR family transcriptional regulator n=1 Tax=Mycolicibacterium tusciae TaxID=75922 RepID=UPI00024A22BB|nr:TetR family transcriptional regulator [Mycolicibacterium tusciae]